MGKVGKTGWVTFQEDGPNVKTNPLASHGGPAVNAVEEYGPQRPKQMKDAVTSKRFILKALHEAGIICFDGGEGDTCIIHLGAAHDVEGIPPGRGFPVRDNGSRPILSWWHKQM